MLNAILPISVLQVIYFALVYTEDVVVMAQGKVRGVAQEGYVSYGGIPYASVNDDAARFKRAGLAPFWPGIRESFSPNCFSTSNVEDCLRLDVNVPITGSAPWPVIVWVRGGPGQYHPGKLVQQGVIVVMVYHRLGVLGFLCLQDEFIPGNAGAKDLVIALRWVRDNIVAFRGNPAKVIVAGQGFGAALVEAMMLSPMSEGLFHGVILQSGTALSPWAFNFDAKERASLLAALINNEDDEYENLASLLLKADTGDLAIRSEKIDKSYYPFGMCAEKAFKNEERLLSDSPFDLLSSKKVYSVPMIVGYNSDEAYIFASNLKGARVLRRISSDATFLLPEELKFFNERERAQVSRQIFNMYLKNNVTMATVLAYHRDAYFLNHIHRSTRLHASAAHAPVYLYQFSHSGAVGVSPEPEVKKTGAAHSDELAYLFSGRDLDGEDGNIQQKLVKLWSNFVKYLTPTPKVGESSTWDPVEPHNLRLLNIGAELRMEQFPQTRTMQLWDDIYDKYYYSRYRTSQR